ncbi:hypothetical protein [Clostridium thermobutyricum]|uniref:hypothetical protein n=1 Tax=Clostridium thermobutyricum TaxID=29372 RepID=UPI0029432A28|nr:hypothetical protein [Clostridium thermobutyricum]
MFDLSKYTKKSVELKFPNGEVVHVKAILKKDVDFFASTANKLSKKDTDKGLKDLDSVMLKILNNNEEGKIFKNDFLDEMEMGEYRGLIEFIKTLIKEDAKKHPSQFQTMK